MTIKDDIKEFNGVKYIKVGDKYVPITKSIEEIQKLIHERLTNTNKH